MSKGIWQNIPIHPYRGNDIWKKALEHPTVTLQVSEFNIWSVLNNQPAGLWIEMGNETLLLPTRINTDIWQELNEETLIIRPHLNIWGELKKIEIKSSVHSRIWQEIGDETLILTTPTRSLWQETVLKGEFTQMKPQRRLGWALKKLSSSAGEEYHILKNLRSGSYLRLNESQVFLWHLMDGDHSIQDMAIAYFIQYRSLAVEGLGVFLAQLEEKDFLAAPRVDIYKQTANRLGQGQLQRATQKIWCLLTEATISIRGIDRIISRIYRAVGPALFCKPVQILIAIITITGLIAFIFHAIRGHFSIIRGGGSNITLGLLALYGAQFLAVLIHEASHALTCKHYNREVHRGGFMLYLGMPAFFVDTSDIWMEPRKPRLLVSWAGPYSGFFLGALASLLIFIVHSQNTAGFLFQFAFASTLLSFTNLNPLLRLDGYYILMDWLEMPMLRNRAIHFLRQDLWQKLKTKQRLNQQERILLIFGALSLGWTIIMTLSALRIAGHKLIEISNRVLNPSLSIAIIICLALTFFILMLIPYLQKRK